MNEIRKLVQALIDECLSTAHSGVTHDGLESDASEALLKAISKLSRPQHDDFALVCLCDYCQSDDDENTDD